MIIRIIAFILCHFSSRSIYFARIKGFTIDLPLFLDRHFFVVLFRRFSYILCIIQYFFHGWLHRRRLHFQPTADSLHFISQQRNAVHKINVHLLKERPFSSVSMYRSRPKINLRVLWKMSRTKHSSTFIFVRIDFLGWSGGGCMREGSYKTQPDNKCDSAVSAKGSVV